VVLPANAWQQRQEKSLKQQGVIAARDLWKLRRGMGLLG
jgi:hypothetical protein